MDKEKVMSNSKDKIKKKNNKKIAAIAIILAAVFLAFLLLIFMGEDEAVAVYSPISVSSNDKGITPQNLDIPNINGWPLNVIHPDYPMEEDIVTELALAPGDEYVDARVLEPLIAMFEAGAEAGLVMYVNSGYRSVSHQSELYNNRIESYMAQGFSEEEAITQTNRWVAPPGTSEHALGVAVDITADEITTTDWEVYSWLAKNAHNFGFTLSFPEDRTEDTGVSYEPWHYRYVGVEAAVYMYENDILLHEYLDIFY